MRLVLLSFLSFGVFSCGIAEDEITPEPFFRFTTENSTLQSNQINALNIASSGVLSIGTDKGVAQLDGVEWSTFDSSSTPLPSNYITALASDPSGNFWVGTDKGLARKSGSAWTVFQAGAGSPAKGETITCLFYDGVYNRLLVGTPNGLLVFQANRWERWNDETSSFIDNHVYSVAADAFGTIYVGAFDHLQFNGRLWKFENSTWSRVKLESKGIISAFPNAIIARLDGSVLLGTGGTNGGHFALLSSFENWTIFDGQHAPFLNGAVTGLLTFGDEIWIAGANGLARYKDNQIKQVVFETSIYQNTFKSITADLNGNLWLGGIGTGLVRLPKNDIE